MHVAAVSKKTGQKYIFFFDDESRTKLVETLAEFVAREDLDFELQDALAVERHLGRYSPGEQDYDWLSVRRQLPAEPTE